MNAEIINNLGKNIILNSPKMRLILICLNKKGVNYAGNISKEIHSCLSNTIKLFLTLTQEGLIEPVENRGKAKYPFISKNKKTKYYRLTDKGKNVTKLLFKLEIVLK